MTQAKHTPGPWLTTTSGRMVITEGRIPCIAEAFGKDAEANARLIASAPELREALLEIDARLRRCFVTGASAAEAYDSFYQEVVSNAISKTTGATT